MHRKSLFSTMFIVGALFFLGAAVSARPANAQDTCVKTTTLTTDEGITYVVSTDADGTTVRWGAGAENNTETDHSGEVARVREGIERDHHRVVDIRPPSCK